MPFHARCGRACGRRSRGSARVKESSESRRTRPAGTDANSAQSGSRMRARIERRRTHAYLEGAEAVPAARRRTRRFFFQLPIFLSPRSVRLSRASNGCAELRGTRLRPTRAENRCSAQWAIVQLVAADPMGTVPMRGGIAIVARGPRDGLAPVRGPSGRGPVVSEKRTI